MDTNTVVAASRQEGRKRVLVQQLLDIADDAEWASFARKHPAGDEGYWANVEVACEAAR